MLRPKRPLHPPHILINVRPCLGPILSHDPHDRQVREFRCDQHLVRGGLLHDLDNGFFDHCFSAFLIASLCPHKDFCCNEHGRKLASAPRASCLSHKKSLAGQSHPARDESNNTYFDPRCHPGSHSADVRCTPLSEFHQIPGN